MSNQAIYLGRQPIVDRRQQLVAYELLFRDSEACEARVTDDMMATAGVVRHTFDELGVPTVLGGCRGYINVDQEALMSPLIDALPKDRVVLELLETIDVDSRVIARCADLKKRGYSLALDDVVTLSDAYEQLLPLVDVVKIDVLQVAPENLAALVRRLKLYSARLLAEKVDTLERAKRCKALGFELFQGFFFAQPALLTGRV